jgi:hypothetical protein
MNKLLKRFWWQYFNIIILEGSEGGGRSSGKNEIRKTEADSVCKSCEANVETAVF